ncbi:MAG: helix-hairpin-helix domain-containing protein [Thermoplasmatota archaeon]
MAASADKLRLVLDYVPCDVCLSMPASSWQEQEMYCGICRRMERTVAHKLTVRQTVEVASPMMPEEVVIPPAIPTPGPVAANTAPAVAIHFHDEPAEASFEGADVDIVVSPITVAAPSPAVAEPPEEDEFDHFEFVRAERDISTAAPGPTAAEEIELAPLPAEAEETDAFGMAPEAPTEATSAAQAEVTSDEFVVPREQPEPLAAATPAPIEDDWADSVLREEPSAPPAEPSTEEVPPPRPPPDEPWPEPGPEPGPGEPFPEPDEERPAETPSPSAEPEPEEVETANVEDVEEVEPVEEVESETVEEIPPGAATTEASPPEEAQVEEVQAETVEDAEPEPAIELAPAPKAESNPENEPVTSLDRVGTRYERRLADEGIRTVGDMAKQDAHDLSSRTGIPERFISKWVADAKAKLGS